MYGTAFKINICITMAKKFGKHKFNFQNRHAAKVRFRNLIYQQGEKEDMEIKNSFYHTFLMKNTNKNYYLLYDIFFSQTLC